MELKSLKRIGTYAQYKLKKFKDLNNELLAELHKDWPRGATHAVFQFGEPIKNEWRVMKPLLPKYNVALIYSARAAAIKAKKADIPDSLVPGRLSLEKSTALFRKNLQVTKKKIKKLGPAFKAEIESALSSFKKARREMLFKDGKPVTLYAIYRRKNYIGKNCDWLLSGWAATGLSKRENAAIDADFWRFCKECRLPVDFKTRSFMRSGQQQARSRGFKPSYVTVAKMA